MATLAFLGKTEKLFKIITNLATTQTDAQGIFRRSARP